MSDLVIWGGPVFAPGSSPHAGGDIGKVRWERPTKIIVFNHGPDGGIGSSAFASLAESYRDADGRILPNLLASQGLSAADFDRIAIAGFSAFHGLANPLLASDGDRIDAAVLLDACFETPGSAPKAGYRSFAARAAKGAKLMVFIGSSGQNGPGLPATTKGYECAESAASAGAADAGTQLEAVATPAGIREVKCGASRAGELWMLNVCDQFYPDVHGGVVNKLTEEVMQSLLAPYLATGPSLLGRIPTWAKWVGFAALLGGAAVGGVKLAKKYG